jgi:hypothetical protein
MMMMDIKNYYLGTPLPPFEYMKILLSRFPEEIIQKYNLNALSVDGWVYIEIIKGMYGLKQAGLLANQSNYTISRGRTGLSNDPRHQKVSPSKLSSNQHSPGRMHIGTLGPHRFRCSLLQH